MEQTMKVRVEYLYDPESDNWCFRVPSLGVIGGAETRQQAEGAALEAIRFTLEDDVAPVTGGDIQYLTVAVTGGA